ncbi:MAG: hypothetical protein ACREKN_07825 [Longimicrobiaceae bacterium]
MIYRFPHAAAYLAFTKLGYVNLRRLLSDGKRDRSARVHGYVQAQLGEHGYLIFVRNGEPFHAFRFEGTERGPIALGAALRQLEREGERGEVGRIGYFGAPEEQLRAMLSTALSPARDAGVPCEPSHPELFFSALGKLGFSGVLELFDGGAFHYLLFDDGRFRTGYFSGGDGGSPAGERVREVLRTAGDSLRTRLHDLLRECPAQPTAAELELFEGFLTGLAAVLRGGMQEEEVRGLFAEAGARSERARPAVEAFGWQGEGVRNRDTLLPADALADGVAAWTVEVVTLGSDRLGLDPSEVVERAAGRHRLALAERGFFQRLPWLV